MSQKTILFLAQFMMGWGKSTYAVLSKKCVAFGALG